IPEQIKQAQLAQAQLALDRRDYQGAIELLEEYTKKNPDDDQIWNTLGALYAEVNQKQKAVTAFQRALAINPDSQTAKQALAELKEEDSPQK
ncbi:MAG: tetratricopeptide repeat protein, partial [Candidatus Angelobacter sp.]